MIYCTCDDMSGNCGEPIPQCGAAINLLITQMQSELFLSLLQISFSSQHEPGLDYGLCEWRGDSREVCRSS